MEKIILVLLITLILLTSCNSVVNEELEESIDSSSFKSSLESSEESIERDSSEKIENEIHEIREITPYEPINEIFNVTSNIPEEYVEDGIWQKHVRFGINIRDRYIYYISKNTIKRYDTINKTINTILTSKESISALKVFKNKMYFTLSYIDIEKNPEKYLDIDNDLYDEIYSMDLDSKKIELIYNNKIDKTFDDKYSIADIIFHHIDEKYIYFTTYNISFSVFQHNLETKETICFNNDVKEFEFINDTMYYIDRSQRTFSLYKQESEQSRDEATLIAGDGKMKANDLENSPPLCEDLIFIENDIFYTTRHPFELYKCVENGEDELLYTFTDNEGNYIYTFSSNESLFSYYDKENIRYLHCYDFDKKENKLIVKIKEPSYLNFIYDGILSYTDGNGKIQIMTLNFDDVIEIK